MTSTADARIDSPEEVGSGSEVDVDLSADAWGDSRTSHQRQQWLRRDQGSDQRYLQPSRVPETRKSEATLEGYSGAVLSDSGAPHENGRSF